MILLAFVSLANCESAKPHGKADTGNGETIQLDFSESIVSKLARQDETTRKKLVCPRLAEAPKIDGALDDAIWKKALAFDPLKKDGPATSVRLGYDNDNLYVAVSCTQASGVPIQATKYATNEGTPWRDDSVEVLLAIPNATATVNYQFIVNAAGSTFGISSEEEFAPGKTGYQGHWTAVVKNDGPRWSVEIAIPKASIKLKEWPAQLQCNIGRTGPAAFQPQSVGGEWGAVGAVALAFEGVEAKPKRPQIAKSADKRQATRVKSSGDALDLFFDRIFARPGERWIEGQLTLSPSAPLDETKVRVELVSMSDGHVFDASEIKPKQPTGRVCVDLRSHNLSTAEVVVRFFEKGKETSVAKAWLTTQAASISLEAGHKISLTVDTAPQTGALTNRPVTFGVPLPEGSIWDIDRLHIVDAQGREVPSQKELMARWGRDGAIKWVRFDTQFSSDGKYSVQFSDEAVGSATSASGLTVKEEGKDRVMLDTGANRYLLGKGASPIREVWMGKQKVATSDGSRGLYVIDQKGRIASATADEETMQVEASGPQTACVRLEGYYKTKDGDPLARHITRIEVFAGQPFAKVTHTLVLCRDSNEVWFKEVGWEFSASCGNTPRAIFGVDRDKPSQSVTQALGGAVKSAYMFQDDHFRFMTNVNHFSVKTIDSTGKPTVMNEGKECGDWAVLVGDQAALLAACSDTARQHPKEFELSADKLVLRLFSNRAGEELDFRSPTLVKKWNLKEWLKTSEYVMFNYKGQTAEKAYADTEKLPSNAIGWAKTHDLLFAPLQPVEAATVAPQIAGPMTFPMYVHVDPQWIYHTFAFGPLYPKDTQRFPEAEDVLQRVFEDWNGRDASMGMYGIMDFQTGPFICHARGDGRWGDIARWRDDYNVRRDLVLMAARSTDRSIRMLAETTNRRVADSDFAHWDGPRRQRGGALIADGGDGNLAGHDALPYWWEGRTQVDTAATSVPDSLIDLYYLTGDRRVKEVLENFFHFAKADWSPAKVRNQFFVLRYLAAYTQGYAFTWDPEFAEMSRATIDLLYDPQSPLLVGIYAYSPSYKVQQDIHHLINAWWTFGDQRLYELAMTRARYCIDTTMGYLDRYQSAQGITSSFLYRQTGESYLAENAASMIRQIGTFYDPATNQILDIRNIPFNAARVGAIMSGLFFTEDAVVRSNADRESVASWAGASFWENQGQHKVGLAGSIIVQKAPNRPVELRYYSENPKLPWAGEIRLKRLEEKEGDWGTDLNTLNARLDQYHGQLGLEKFAPPGSYEISNGQTLFVWANERRPMVVYAPDNWIPAPDQRPFVPIYFKVPTNAKDGQIFFEGSARLFDPNGKPYPDDKPVTGQVKLPSDRAGLWNFQPVVNKKVRVTNLPPFFAFRDPSFYFEPPIPPKVSEATLGKAN